MTKRFCAIGMLCVFISPIVKGQVADHAPVKWDFAAIPLNDKKAKLIFTANLDEGWHIYSQFIEAGGPLPTTFTFIPDNNYSLKGKVKEEGKPFKSYDSIFMMKIVWYKNTVVFSQEVNLQAPVTTIRGKVEFMSCTHETCLPPKEIPFILEVRTAREEKSKGK